MENIWENFSGGDHRADRITLKYALVASKISDALADKRISKGMFAAMMNVQPSIVTRWLSGKHNFTLETLFAIEEVLQTRLIDIEVPQNNTISFEIKINSHQASFEQSKMFPGFMHIDYGEEKSNDNKEELSDDLSAYFKQLQTDLAKKK